MGVKFPFFHAWGNLPRVIRREKKILKEIHNSLEASFSNRGLIKSGPDAFVQMGTWV